MSALSAGAAARLRRLRALALCTLALLPAGRAAAQEASLPAELQVELIGKVLRFDRNLDRYGREVVLAFLYQAGNRQSDRVARDLSDAARSVHAVGPGRKAFRTLLLPYGQGADFRAELRRQGVALLYVSPMRAVDLARLIQQAHEAGILTISGDPEPIQAGVAIGLKERGPRPAVSIRLGSARRAGADFESGLLRLVEVQP